MSRRPLTPTKTLIERQKQSAESLRQELMGSDGFLDHPYYRCFERLSRDYRAPIALSDVHAAGARASALYVGDFHAVPAYQRLAADLLGSMVRNGGPVALGVEFVFTRQQRVLDRRQSGEIADDEFLRRIHYDEQWGYPWEGYRDLLDRARSLGVAVVALDAAPRGDFTTLGQRDDHAARRIAAIFGERPDTRLLVLFGETHLTPDHLPRRVKKRVGRAGLERDEVVVLQSPDQLYWKALSREDSLPEAMRIDDRTFAVMHTAPLHKYEAYRQVLERWQADEPAEGEVDLTPAVHHLIEVLLRWIGIRATRRRLRHRAGWTDELIDVFPEVYSGTQAFELLGPVLAEHGRTAEELAEAEQRLRAGGAFYEPRSNSLFLRRYLPGPVAGEGARFLRAALTGRLFVAPEDFADDPIGATYGAAYNEALAYLGSRLIDPTTECFDADTVDRPAAAANRHWLEAHRRFEATSRVRLPEDLGESMRRSRPLRRALARDLGRRVGAMLVERVQAEAIDQRGLRRLFTRRVAPRQFVRLMLRWLRRQAPSVVS